jgi:NADPH-dependent 2,4-dienoyl-CoA reductase/sulfur reductase-like enzyme
MQRRNFFKLMGAASAVAILPKLSYGATTTKNIVVVGGGLGGAAAAKYLKIWGGSNVKVTLITPASTYVTCIQSNLVITGAQPVSSITRNYNTLKSSYGVTIQPGSVTGITRGSTGGTVSVKGLVTPISYDYLILAPGVKGTPYSDDPNLTLSYWEGSKASDLNKLLQRPSLGSLGKMPDGGTFVMYIPSGTIKGALAPYGRACAVADYLKGRGCRVIVLDGHPDIPSQKNDFVAAFNSFGSTLVAGTNNFTGPVIDYYAGVTLNNMNLGAKKIVTSAGEFSYHVANVIPPQVANLGFAPDLLLAADKVTKMPFAPVKAQTFESIHDSRIYIIGDAQGTTLPKSGNIAADQAKIVASVITRQIAGITALETSLAIAAIQFNAIRSTSAKTAVYAHAGFQWNGTAHPLENPAQTANSWVASGAFLNANGTDSNAGVSATAALAANISARNYSQGLTWANSLLADCFGA